MLVSCLETIETVNEAAIVGHPSTFVGSMHASNDGSYVVGSLPYFYERY